MKRFRLSQSLPMLVITLIGGATHVSAQVKPPDPKGAARSYFDAQLKDPDSALYRFGVLYYCKEGALPVFNGTEWAGAHWVMEVSYNAKNSFGGYVGYESYLVFFDGDRVLNAFKEGLMGQVLAAACSETGPQVGAPKVFEGENVLPYLFEQLKRPSYSRPYKRLFAGETGVPAWAREGSGPCSPGRTVTFGGETYELYSVCQAHNCASDNFHVLFSPRAKKAWGLLKTDDRNFRYFGKPKPQMQNVLMVELSRT